MSLSLNSTLKLNSGYEIPVLGLGTWRSDVGKVTEAVKVALLAGYRHIDAAWIYQNEDEVGAGIKAAMQENAKITRDSIFVTTKLWNTFHHPDAVEGALRESLKKLGLDYVDLYLVHWPVSFNSAPDNVFGAGDANIPLKDTWKAMEKLVEKGLTRSIGVSNYNLEQMKELLEYAIIKPVTNQCEAHPHFPNSEVYEFCRQHGMVFTAYSSLGKISDSQSSPMDELKVKQLAEKYKKSPAQILYRWGLQRGYVVLPKSVTPSRVLENAAIFDFEISESDMNDLNALEAKNDKKIRPKWCNF